MKVTFWNSVSVRFKLLAIFGVLVLLIIAICSLAIHDLHISSQRFAGYVEGIGARVDAAHSVRQAVDLRAIAARNLVLVSAAADVEHEKQVVQRAVQDVRRHLGKLTEMAKAPDVPEEARRRINAIAEIEKQYEPVALAIVDMAIKQQQAAAIAKMNEQCRPLLAALIKATDEYTEMATQSAAKMVASSQREYDEDKWRLLLASGIAILLATAAAALIVRSVVRPLDKAVSCIDAVAHGDLSQDLVIDTRDEFAVLFQSLQNMQAELSHVVASVRQGADAVSAASAQIAGGNHDLSSRTETQADALRQTASSMEQLEATVKLNAEHASEANQLAQSASSVAQRGGKVVLDVVDTMRGISDSSKRIAEIINVIDGIAFQTNILALNAAVEAARAGEQGRGFAVVAGEVRSLAGRSAEAAREIKQLISDSVGRVEAGAVLVDQAGDTMRDVVGSIDRVTNIMGEISLASTEQSQGVEQVSHAVAGMDQSTQQNATLVDEMASAAVNLNELARELVQSVAVFKLGEHAALRGASAAMDTGKAPARLSRGELQALPG